LGDTNTVVIEDTGFHFTTESDGATDAYPGTKFVVRHCAITNTSVGLHGKDSSVRSTRLWEFYENDFYYDGSSPPAFLMHIRGGTGVIWSNRTHSAVYDVLAHLSQLRAEVAYGDAPGQSYDGNFHLTYPSSNYATGYPLLDQIGWGSFTNAPGGSYPWNQNDPNCTSGCTTNTFQRKQPIYQWGNNLNGTLNPLLAVGNPADGTNYIKPNREYFDNTVHPTYTALTYPHPLRGEGGGSPAPGATATVGTLRIGP